MLMDWCAHLTVRSIRTDAYVGAPGEHRSASANPAGFGGILEHTEQIRRVACLYIRGISRLP